MTAKKRLAALLASDEGIADRILAAFEPAAEPRMSSPEAAAAIVRPLLAGRGEERLVVVALDRRRNVIEVETLTIGGTAITIVEARQIFRWALTRKRATNAIIIAHNHPSGDPSPSTQDRDVTRRVAHAGRLLGIPLLDHVVIGVGSSFWSFAAAGDLPIYSDDPLL